MGACRLEKVVIRDSVAWKFDSECIRYFIWDRDSMAPVVSRPIFIDRKYLFIFGIDMQMMLIVFHMRRMLFCRVFRN